MTTQPEALRLADALDAVPETGADPDLIQKSAAELRRLHAECNDLAHQLNESNERNGRLKAQRDALLEVLRLARVYVNTNTLDGYHAEVKADAAILMAEEQK